MKAALKENTGKQTKWKRGKITEKENEKNKTL